MDLNIRKIKNHPPSPSAEIKNTLMMCFELLKFIDISDFFMLHFGTMSYWFYYYHYYYYYYYYYSEYCNYEYIKVFR